MLNKQVGIFFVETTVEACVRVFAFDKVPVCIIFIYDDNFFRKSALSHAPRTTPGELIS